MATIASFRFWRHTLALHLHWCYPQLFLQDECKRCKRLYSPTPFSLMFQYNQYQFVMGRSICFTRKAKSPLFWQRLYGIQDLEKIKKVSCRTLTRLWLENNTLRVDLQSFFVQSRILRLITLIVDRLDPCTYFCTGCLKTKMWCIRYRMVFDVK